MNMLAQQQQALLDALFVRPGSSESKLAAQQLHGLMQPQFARGLMAYQANGHELAERSLRAAYPVIAQLIGQDSFNALARDHWHSSPPEHGDLARWGEQLPRFLAANEQLNDVPYLADVACVEWALHLAAGAADAETDLPSFARLSSEDPGKLTLVLAPGAAIIASPWPVVSLITAHTEGQPSLSEVGQRVQDRVNETAVVWRQGWRSCVAACSSSEAAVLRALIAAESLPTALDQHPVQTDDGFHFSQWLAQAVQSGLVIGVASATPQSPQPQEVP